MSSAFTSSHDPLRRRLLMALALSPLLGSLPGRAADVPPDIARVAALEWLPIELLLALGVTPLAVADVHNYNLWVAEPKLPAAVVDVGQRTEPILNCCSSSSLRWCCCRKAMARRRGKSNPSRQP